MGWLMMNLFYKYFIIFFVGSIGGWVVVVLYAYFRTKKFQNRSSVLYGTFGYVYGYGAVFLTMALSLFSNSSIILTFIISFVTGTITEYIISYILEKSYGYVVWDYSKVKFNINGRVCLLYSIYWGFLGVIWSKYIIKIIDDITSFCYYKLGTEFLTFMLIFLTINSLISHLAIKRSGERIKNKRANNKIDLLLDKYYSDERLKKTFPQIFEYRR